MVGYCKLQCIGILCSCSPPCRSGQDVLVILWKKPMLFSVLQLSISLWTEICYTLKDQSLENGLLCIFQAIGNILYFSLIQVFATPWAVALQAPLSVGFSRQEYWSGLTFPSPGDLPHPGIEPMSLVSPALVGEFFTTGATDIKTVRCAHSETKLVGKWIEKLVVICECLW